MDAIFTIPYGEFAAADKLIKSVTKYRKVSAFVPASRQEKGIDLVLYSDVGAKNEFIWRPARTDNLSGRNTLTYR